MANRAEVTDSFRWNDEWAQLPDAEDRRQGWAHHALTVRRNGDVVGFHPSDGRIVVFAPDGEIRRMFDVGLTEGHGAALVEEDGVEYLWVADPAIKMVPDDTADTGYVLAPPRAESTDTPPRPPGWGRVAKIGLDAEKIVDELPTPAHPEYDAKPFKPTAVAVGPDGSVWVADGYGASLLHLYSPDGNLVRTIGGEESEAGRLDCPHGLLIDTRRDAPVLYVADRENRRLVVFDLDGEFQRTAADGHLERPCAMAIHGDRMAVAELRARLTLLDLDDRIVGTIGANTVAADGPHWPNSRDERGRMIRPSILQRGTFHAPHGIATDGQGRLYVTEWIVGGRYVELQETTAGT